jgi:hypothetical protein
MPNNDNFTVTINEMIEAGKSLYFVSIDHPKRPADALPWDKGRMDVYKTLIKENAEHEKEYWDEFFNYDPQDNNGE